MSWNTLPKEDKESFIKSVATEDHKILFEPSICDVYVLPLEFYDGYHLTRIANKYTIPYVQLDYLSNGENHYYLDGSDGVFHNLNSRGAISLSERNAFDYLNLYISYVYEHGNSLGFAGTFEDSIVSYDEGARSYKIKTPLIYKDKKVDGEIEITERGAIHIKNPVTVTFLDDLKTRSDIDYVHEHETQIIEQCKTLLSSSENGGRLLGLMAKNKPKVTILPSPNYQGFCTNMRTIYMTMPAEERTGKYLQALVLAGAIADMEQVIAGHIHPHPEQDEELFGDTNIGKNLDITLEMCKIVKEWEDINIPEGVRALSKLGLIGVYHGFKTGHSNDALMELYLAALKEKHIIG